MEYSKLLGILLLTAIAGVLLASLSSRQRRWNRYREAISLFCSTAPERRHAALEPLLRKLDIHAPAWYLEGLLAMREGRFREAARAFGIAHHADSRLQTAALFTFAGLKASSKPSTDVIEELLLTWEEMNRPNLRETKEDRWVLEAAAKSAPDPPGGSELARTIWCVLGTREQDLLRRMMGEGSGWSQELRA